MDAEEMAPRARAGDEQALRRLCAHYRPRLCRYLYHMTGCRSGAGDLAQETLLRMIGALARCRKRPDAGFEGWLLCIAHNQCISPEARLRLLPRLRRCAEKLRARTRRRLDKGQLVMVNLSQEG